MGKDGAAAAAGAVRGRSSDRLGGRCSVPERAVSAQGRASGRGQGASVPLVAAQGNAEAAGGGGDASVLHATRRTVMARWVTGLENTRRSQTTSVLDACVRAAGRSWWGKADLAGGRVQGAGGELSRTHVCERMPSYLIRASPRRCIVWLPRLNRSATVGSSTCTLTKCGYLSVVDVACEIQYRRPSDSNLRG